MEKEQEQRWKECIGMVNEFLVVNRVAISQIEAHKIWQWIANVICASDILEAIEAGVVCVTGYDTANEKLKLVVAQNEELSNAATSAVSTNQWACPAMDEAASRLDWLLKKDGVHWE